MNECHFGALFVESGIYDFVNIERRLSAEQEVSPAMLSAAFGLWGPPRTEPLLPFLLERARAGKLVLGGLDDQIGRGTYAQLEMPDHLLRYLRGDTRRACLSVLTRYTKWQYTDDAPYNRKENAAILGCLRMLDAAAASSPATEATVDRQLLASLTRDFRRDFPESGATGADTTFRTSNARDSSMYQNFEWLSSRLPRRTKVIVWAATTHIAKRLSSVPGKLTQVPFTQLGGAKLHDKVFVLAFTAGSGTYGMPRQTVRELSEAPDTTLEGRALRDSPNDMVYVGPQELASLGTVSARLASVDFTKARWANAFDAVVVIRRENPL